MVLPIAGLVLMALLKAATAREACLKSENCEEGYKCMLNRCVLDVQCPETAKYGRGPPEPCKPPTDPKNLPKSKLESWFTKEAFEDLFPKANLGWGPAACFPYSYEAFVIASRYFPRFASESPNNGYSAEENYKRDLAAFFSHAVQETGENDASLYETFSHDRAAAHACFYRGGFYNWFEGGPTSSFFPKNITGYNPEEGGTCLFHGKYCVNSAELDYWYPCNPDTVASDDDKAEEYYKGCYFGRGAIQISYNYNYGQFQTWLEKVGIFVNLLREPNLILTKMDPPLSVLASMWFYMTPQPPKPAMHDIVMGNWEPGRENRQAGYEGAIFGPTSLVINNECNGEDEREPGGPGESRRIKAFKWFCDYFDVPVGPEHLLTCKGMPKMLDVIRHNQSWQPNWLTTWKSLPCDCAPASYGGMLPYYQEGFYPEVFTAENEINRRRCILSIYDNPTIYSMNSGSSLCLNVPIPRNLRRQHSDKNKPSGCV